MVPDMFSELTIFFDFTVSLSSRIIGVSVNTLVQKFSTDWIAMPTHFIFIP